MKRLRKKCLLKTLLEKIFNNLLTFPIGNKSQASTRKSTNMQLSILKVLNEWMELFGVSPSGGRYSKVVRMSPKMNMGL